MSHVESRPSSLRLGNSASRLILDRCPATAVSGQLSAHFFSQKVAPWIPDSVHVLTEIVPAAAGGVPFGPQQGVVSLFGVPLSTRPHEPFQAGSVDALALGTIQPANWLPVEVLPSWRAPLLIDGRFNGQDVVHPTIPRFVYLVFGLYQQR